MARIGVKMSSATAERLKAIPKSRCAKCDTPRSYTNPLAKCWECSKKFCYDHVVAYIGKKCVEDYCFKCKENRKNE